MKAIQVAELASALGVKLARPPLAVRPQSPLQDPSTGDVSTRTARPERQAAQPGTIENVASIAAAGPGSLVFAEDAATLEAALSSLAGAILLPEKLTGGLTHLPGTAACGPVLLLADQPRLAFAHAARLLRPLQDSGGVHASAVVAGDAQVGHGVTIEALAVVEPQASIGADSSIGAGAIIGAGVSIGTGCRIYPRVVLYPGTQLGDRVVVHAGAVLGADGFGYVRDRQTGAYLQFPQQGTLVIEDDVEIGANTTIDRGALEETRIRRGTKLDNLVHIGHNVDVGEDVVIAAQTGVSGSSTIGRGAVIAGQVGIADHVTIGEGAILGAQCGVPSRKRLQGAGVLFWGTPARPIQQYLRELASLARLSRAGRVKAGHDRVPAHKQEED